VNGVFMSKTKIVFITNLPTHLAEVISTYTPEDFETTIINENIDSDDAHKLVADAEFIIAFGVALSDSLIRAGTKVKLIQLLSAGYDRMNFELLHDLGIPCANNGGANSWAVADHAVLLMLALYKKLTLSDKGVREGNWRGVVNGFNTYEMSNKKVGIYGIGNIGKKVAKRVQGFDCIVQYYDKYRLSENDEKNLNLSYVTLEELFKTSDIITLHSPLTAETKGAINTNLLTLMKSSAILINTSRGPVINEPDLISALQNDTIAGAGLDVMNVEPIEKDNPLLSMDNTIVTPHSAGTTWDTWFRRAEFAYTNIKNVHEGNPPQGVAKDYEN